MTDIIDKLSKVRQGVMFIIGAASGTGKSTVIRRLLEQDANLNWSVSVTTRKRREGEVDGVDYHYVTDEEYDNLRAQDAFYECVDSQYGNRYGTLRSEVDGFINVGKDVIFDVDWEGLRQIREKAPKDVVSIYMLPPSIKELRRRLEGRGTDSVEIINKRMSLVGEQLKHWKEYDYVVVCGDLEQTIFKVAKIISAERMKRYRQLGLNEFAQQLIDEVSENV